MRLTISLVCSEPAASFYVTLSIVNIHKPRWYIWMTRVKVGGFFAEGGIVPGGTLDVNDGRAANW